MMLRVARAAVLATLASSGAIARAQSSGSSVEPPPSNVRVAITSPAAADYLTGPTRLAAEISNPADVASVNFFVDGREVCAVKAAPYGCVWDAGREIRTRQVRLVVTLKDGRRLPVSRAGYARLSRLL